MTPTVDGRRPVDVAAVVVTHDSADVLPGLLASLPDGLAGCGPWHLVVADSGSRDAGPAIARRAGATVVTLGANLGFGAGVNAAVAAAPDHRHVLVLNPDVRLAPGCGARLRDAAGPDVGVVVPRLVDARGATAPSLRRRPALHRAAAEAVLGGRVAGRWGLGEVVDVASGAYSRRADVDWASGAVWLVRAECFAALGGFDERFFLYSEETDFARRARDAGYRVVVEPRAGATHLGGASNRDPALYALLTRNRVSAYRRHHGPAATAAFGACLLLGEGLRAPWRRRSRAAAAALLGRAQVLPDGYRGRRNAGHQDTRSAPGRRLATMRS